MSDGFTPIVCNGCETFYHTQTPEANCVYCDSTVRVISKTAAEGIMKIRDRFREFVREENKH